MELGLIDEIGGLSDALACLHKMIEQRNQEKTEGLRDSPAPYPASAGGCRWKAGEGDAERTPGKEMMSGEKFGQ